MYECQNCQSHVTAKYAKVFTPPNVDEPRVCPNCTDMVRTGSEVRKANSVKR
jgi:hypothetical protein